MTKGLFILGKLVAGSANALFLRKVFVWPGGLIWALWLTSRLLKAGLP